MACKRFGSSILLASTRKSRSEGCAERFQSSTGTPMSTACQPEEVGPITICLAAIGQSGGHHFAVVAADRMVTLGGFMEFEHGARKMAHPSPQAVVMVAGDTLVGTRLAREVSAALNGSTPRTSDIAQHLGARYQDVRRQSMENQVLHPRGLSLDQFYGNQASLSPQIAIMIDQTLSQFNLGVELLLAGVDQDGAHIFSIHNPGGAELQHDVIGYAAIGSGAIHAVQSMVGFRHDSTAALRETIFRAYASKRRSEVAPGVGLDTDMAVISATGVRWISNDAQEQLAKLYAANQAKATSDLSQKLADLNIEEEEEERENDEDGAESNGG